MKKRFKSHSLRLFKILSLSSPIVNEDIRFLEERCEMVFATVLRIE
jgi:hypothetical protein